MEIRRGSPDLFNGHIHRVGRSTAPPSRTGRCKGWTSDKFATESHLCSSQHDPPPTALTSPTSAPHAVSMAALNFSAPPPSTNRHIGRVLV